MRHTTSVSLLTLTLAALTQACASPELDRPPPAELPGPVHHVLHVSVDGLRPDAIDALGPDRAPSFFRLRAEGATTDNARTDPKLAATLPGHACQLTSRPVFGSEGHGWALNDELDERLTLHLVKATYVPSVFDVVHDSGFSTGFYASKRKFAVFTRSWGEFGAPDPTGADDGTDKLDLELVDGDMQALVERFLADYAAAPPTYAFLHLREPDSTGHSEGWDLRPDRAYLAAVEDVDRILGRILDVIDASPRRASTALIVTADHGGDLGTENHVLAPDVGLYESGIVPFYVRGPEVAPGADLYGLNEGRRLDPGRTTPGMNRPLQPIRNGDAGNLALQLLGLPPIPRSTINAEQDLDVRGPRP